MQSAAGAPTPPHGARGRRCLPDISASELPVLLCIGFVPLEPCMPRWCLNGPLVFLSIARKRTLKVRILGSLSLRCYSCALAFMHKKEVCYRDGFQRMTKIGSAKIDPVRFKWGFGEVLLKDKFAFKSLFRVLYLRGENCL